MKVRESYRERKRERGEGDGGVKVGILIVTEIVPVSHPDKLNRQIAQTAVRLHTQITDRYHRHTDQID